MFHPSINSISLYSIKKSDVSGSGRSKLELRNGGQEPRPYRTISRKSRLKGVVSLQASKAQLTTAENRNCSNFVVRSERVKVRLLSLFASGSILISWRSGLDSVLARQYPATKFNAFSFALVLLAVARVFLFCSMP